MAIINKDSAISSILVEKGVFFYKVFFFTKKKNSSITKLEPTNKGVKQPFLISVTDVFWHKLLLYSLQELYKRCKFQ